RRLRPIQAGEPPLHQRAARSPRGRGRRHDRARRPSRQRSNRPVADELAPGARADQPSSAQAQLLARAEPAARSPADAARRGRSVRPRRRLLRPRRPVPVHRLPDPRGVERSFARRGRGATAMGRVRAADGCLVQLLSSVQGTGVTPENAGGVSPAGAPHRSPVAGPREAKGGRYHHGDLRAALIETAIQLIAERGVRNFSLAEASRRVGVAVSAPYAHFSDRDELLAAVAAYAYELF